jgi:hypothetical protein
MRHQDVFKRFKIRQRLDGLDLLFRVHIKFLNKVLCLAVDHNAIIAGKQVIVVDDVTNRSGGVSGSMDNPDR